LTGRFVSKEHIGNTVTPRIKSYTEHKLMLNIIYGRNSDQRLAEDLFGVMSTPTYST